MMCDITAHNHIMCVHNQYTKTAIAGVPECSISMIMKLYGMIFNEEIEANCGSYFFVYSIMNTMYVFATSFVTLPGI